ERYRALVAAPILEVEADPDARDADTVEPDPGERPVHEPAEDEQERFHRVERELEGDRLLDRAAERPGREWPRVLAARRAHELGTRGTEPRRRLGDGEARELAEAADAPALERGRERRRRAEAGERERCEEADLRPGRHDLDPVERRQPCDRHARPDGGAGG